MKNQSEALAAKVAAFNSAHKEANRLVPLVLAALAPFVGQKVMKATGGMMQKVKEALPEMPNTVPLSIWLRDSHGYSLILNVKACQSYGDHFCTYAEACPYVAELKDGILSKLYDFTPYRTDFTAGEVLEKRETLAKAKQAARDAESALYPFGEYEN